MKHLFGKLDGSKRQARFTQSSQRNVAKNVQSPKSWVSLVAPTLSSASGGALLDSPVAVVMCEQPHTTSYPFNKQ